MAVQNLLSEYDPHGGDDNRKTGLPMPLTDRGLTPALQLTGVLIVFLLQGCAATVGPGATVSPTSVEGAYTLANRITWGATPGAVEQLNVIGTSAYLAGQLHPANTAGLPNEVQAQIDGMTIVQRPLVNLVQDMEQLRKNAEANTDDDTKKAAQRAYQSEMNRLAREAATRHLLRALYSPYQVQEEMTWFWLNHFSVHQAKSNLRAMVGDYENTAIRPHALGKFRDLLGSVAQHPAMLRYLDNEQNAAGRINENFARELMELHTLGVDAGYTQHDVQELARVLTGVGINLGTTNPGQRKELQGYYVRRGLFEFNPTRHDFGDKELLGQPIRNRGLAELDEALDRLARSPATARFICRKLATYWLTDEPPHPLLQAMEQFFVRSDGDIAGTLKVLFTSPEFLKAGQQKFKDPVRFVVSAVRLAYDDKPVLNVGPMLNWINRMGEPLYGRPTPDGYSLQSVAWASPGQLTTRFEVAKAIGSGSAGLFRTDGPQPVERPAFPQLANPLYYQSISKTLGPATRKALEQATSQQEWNTYLLASPEMMRR
jgi:uncharacterized protein (DUF1800 family)